MTRTCPIIHRSDPARARTAQEQELLNWFRVLTEKQRREVVRCVKREASTPHAPIDDSHVRD